jgi:hypothetical protein
MADQFDLYSTSLDQEARRALRNFSNLTYDKAVEILDKKAKNLQASYSESSPPLHGCITPLSKSDIDAAFNQGILR